MGKLIQDSTSRPQSAQPILLHPAFIFAVTFVVIFLLHAPLLSLPYFWDEAGYYVPAARDLLLTGSLIPHTTVSNAHPPLVMVWLAIWWKLVGFAPLVTRTAMLVVSAFSLLGIFRLAQRAANTPVAIASTLCTALYPVFFAQSSLAQIDLAAAGFTFWGLLAYLDDRPGWQALWFSLALLAKETAIVAPAALAAWEFGKYLLRNKFWQVDLKQDCANGDGVEISSRTKLVRALALIAPVLPLTLWYAYHYARTGYVFGNPEFFRYNVAATLNLTRFFLALVLRLWQVFGYLHLWLLTLAMLLAMLLPPVSDRGVPSAIRPRIALSVQMVFYVVIAAYIVAMSAIGGAVLARYMLPVVPLLIIIAISTLRRRLRHWTPAVAFIALAFVAGWFWNPPYGFSPEDNLAYRDYILLHENAERFLEARYPNARVLTAWPASDELTRPWLGYTTRPMQVVRIDDFSATEVLSAAEFRANFNLALVFSTKYEPAHPLFGHWKTWERLKTRFFNFHRDLPPALIAHLLGAHLVYSDVRRGQWVAVLEVERNEPQEAEYPSETPHKHPQELQVSARYRLPVPDLVAHSEFRGIPLRPSNDIVFSTTY
ncbi:MAG TPA: glycosyltransferase family 39 protein [Candidatus Sulfotelmatobacter sp.]|nr:glycosyltransferase family 39 protein [Candidatus Sulfotelmatobacter sp.]